MRMHTPIDPVQSSFAADFPSAAERRAAGRRLRDMVPRESHAKWQPSADPTVAGSFLAADALGRVYGGAVAASLLAPDGSVVVRDRSDAAIRGRRAYHRALPRLPPLHRAGPAATVGKGSGTVRL